ncbi:MAG TPA: GTPase domain-containing protein [Candidatus Limnocylindria bacterium]|nr:GTPase domain-containing protein [Candidatus Limnocylindria bacterium]
MSLAVCLAALADAADAAASLGLDTSRAQGVLDEARARLGFAGSAYVLALVGGTGVGKSSLLNALAGDVVSPASARRPTTSGPVAWVSRGARTETAELLAWLGVNDVRDHAGPEFGDVAILDLPDIDSTTPEHRARVDGLLPRIDAVVWVADPEKYRDAVLHDDYLRRWAPRLARQLVVLNKADRVPGDVQRVREHLAASLRDDGLERVAVAVTSATPGGDVRQLRDWIAEGVEAKRVVSARIGAEICEAARELATRAGVGAGAPPLVTADRRARVLADVTREAAAVIDLRGLERQAVAATRLAARPRGAGPLGPITAFIYRATGRDRSVADPEGYLLRWRERGNLARPAEPVRLLIAELMSGVAPEARGAVASLVDVATLRDRVAGAIDTAVASRVEEVRAPASWVWTVIGALQYVVTAGMLFVALWLAAVFFLHAPFASVDVPVLGPIPTPLLVLAGLLLAGYILARLLGAHAGLLGRRWAQRLRDDLTHELETRLGEALFAPLAIVDASRARVAAARVAIDAECGPE